MRAAVTNERGRWVTHREEMKKTLKVAKKKHGADYKQQLTPTIAKDLDSLQLRLTNEPLDVTIGPAAGGEITASMRGRSGGAGVGWAEENEAAQRCCRAARKQAAIEQRFFATACEGGANPAIDISITKTHNQQRWLVEGGWLEVAECVVTGKSRRRVDTSPLPWY